MFGFVILGFLETSFKSPFPDSLRRCNYTETDSYVVYHPRALMFTLAGLQFGQNIYSKNVAIRDQTWDIPLKSDD